MPDAINYFIIDTPVQSLWINEMALKFLFLPPVLVIAKDQIILLWEKANFSQWDFISNLYRN